MLKIEIVGFMSMKHVFVCLLTFKPHVSQHLHTSWNMTVHEYDNAVWKREWERSFTSFVETYPSICELCIKKPMPLRQNKFDLELQF